MANKDQHPLLDILAPTTFLVLMYMWFEKSYQRRQTTKSFEAGRALADRSKPKRKKAPGPFTVTFYAFLGIMFKIVLALAIFATICDIAGADFVTQDPFAETSVEQEEMAEQEEPMEQEGAVVQTAPAASPITDPRYQATQGEIECSYARDLLREQYSNMSYSSQWEELLDRGYTAQEVEFAMGQ